MRPKASLTHVEIQYGRSKVVKWPRDHPVLRQHMDWVGGRFKKCPFNYADIVQWVGQKKSKQVLT